MGALRGIRSESNRRFLRIEWNFVWQSALSEELTFVIRTVWMLLAMPYVNSLVVGKIVYLHHSKNHQEWR